MVSLVAGIPASGKSTIARQMFGRVLEYDTFADELGSYEELDEDRDLVNSQFLLLAGSGLYDAAVDVFSTRSWRAQALSACPGAGIVVVRAPLDECLRRNARRASWAKNEDVLSIAMGFEPVSPDEGFSFIKYIDNFVERGMENKVWLKVSNGKVLAFGDRESLQASTKGAFDMELAVEQWEACGCSAYVGEGGAIVLGEDPADVYERHAQIVRHSRHLRLRQCDKMRGSMRWDEMSEPRRDAWRRYRQALLDIPQQPGFPWGGDPDIVPWPVKPE